MKHFLVVVLIFSSCLLSTSAMQCYNCEYPKDPECEDPVNVKVQKCDEVSAADKTVGIRMGCSKVQMSLGEIKHIKRECSQILPKFDQCVMAKMLGAEHCSICEAELCNGSISLTLRFWNIVLPVLTTLTLKLFS